MEMVAAAKMRKATEVVIKTRTYSQVSWEIVLNLAKSVNANTTPHPLLTKKKNVNNVGIILISSNRGLCGGFNTAIINKVIRSIKKYQETGEKKVNTDFILLGKKGASIYRNYGYNIVADFPKMDLTPEFREVVPVADMAIQGFLSGKYDKIMVAYTDFVNASVQTPHVKQLLPIDIDAMGEYLGIAGQDTRIGVGKKFIEEKEKEHLGYKDFRYKYVLEPSPEEVLDAMIPKLIQIQLYQALLESSASEHGARMTAMHKATDAASDMSDELTLFYNKERQAAITAEIAEISAGADALAK